MRCAVTGIVYRPLVKRATQRNSRRRALCYAQPPSQYSAQRMTPHIRKIMCILHKNKLKNGGYFMQFFVRSLNFLFRPQYIVFKPAKMRYFQMKSTIYCVRVKLAFPSKIVYHVRSTASHRTYPHRLRCTAPPHSKRTAHCLPVCTLPSKRRPVKAAHLHSKRTAPLTAGGSYKPAQHQVSWKAKIRGLLKAENPCRVDAVQCGGPPGEKSCPGSIRTQSKIVGGVRGPS